MYWVTFVGLVQQIMIRKAKDRYRFLMDRADEWDFHAALGGAKNYRAPRPVNPFGKPEDRAVNEPDPEMRAKAEAIMKQLIEKKFKGQNV